MLQSVCGCRSSGSRSVPWSCSMNRRCARSSATSRRPTVIQTGWRGPGPYSYKSSSARTRQPSPLCIVRRTISRTRLGAGLVGAANAISIAPSLRLAPRRGLTVAMDAALYWRQRLGRLEAKPSRVKEDRSSATREHPKPSFKDRASRLTGRIRDEVAIRARRWTRRRHHQQSPNGHRRRR